MKDPVNKKDLPFPKRWLGYIAIKLAVLILAVLLAFYLAGQL